MTARYTPAQLDRIHQLALARAAQLRAEAAQAFWAAVTRSFASLLRAPAALLRRPFEPRLG